MFATLSPDDFERELQSERRILKPGIIPLTRKDQQELHKRRQISATRSRKREANDTIDRYLSIPSKVPQTEDIADTVAQLNIAQLTHLFKRQEVMEIAKKT